MAVLRESWNRFGAFVETMETRPWGPGHVVGILAAVILLRNLVEIAVAQNPVFPGIAAFVHYPLAYAGPFLSLTLVLAAWSGVAPARVARLMALAWLLTLTPPLADLLLDHHHETPTIGYLEIDPSLIPTVLVRFFDPGFALSGTTAGIRLETLAAVLLGALYAGLRSSRWLRALGCALSVYAVSLFWFLLPNLAWLALKSLVPRSDRDDFYRGESLLPRMVRENATDATAILWLVPVLSGLFAAWILVERMQGADPAWTRPFRSAPRDGLGAFLPALMIALCSGYLVAFTLRYAGVSLLVRAPFDYMAPFCALLALLALTLAARWQSRGAPFLAGGLAILGASVASALGTPVALGLLGAAAPLLAPLPSGESGPWRGLRAVALGGGSALAAFCAGTALVFGSEALARLPVVFYPAWLSAGALIAAGLSLRSRGGRAAMLALAPCTAPLAIGAWPLAPIAVATGALAGLAAFFLDPEAEEHSALRSWRVAAGPVVAALAVLVILSAGLANEKIAGPLAEKTRCVARLERIRAEKARAEGRLETARTIYRSALKCDQNDLGSIRGLAQIDLQERDFAAAERRLTRALLVAGPSPELFSERAVARHGLDRIDAALEDLDAGLALDGSSPTLLFNRARMLEEAGETGQAIAAWELYLERAGARLDAARDVIDARKSLRRLRRGSSESR